MSKIKLIKYINKHTNFINYLEQCGGIINKLDDEINIRCEGHNNLKYNKYKIPDDYPLYMKKYALPKNDTYVTVIRDDLIPGGTKQRAWRALTNITKNEIVYAGPYTGYAQVALAIIALKLNKCATVFLTKDDHKITLVAKKYGLNVIAKPNKHLYELQNYAKKYAKFNNAHLMEFGFNSKEIVDELIRTITNSTIDVLDRFDKHTFWIAGGSGTLLNVLYNVFPNSKFNVVQVGKELKKNIIDKPRITVYISPEKFDDTAILQPPYKTVSSYDAKIWTFIVQNAHNGDIVWNVAGDDDLVEFKEIDNINPNYNENTKNIIYESKILELFRKSHKSPRKIIKKFEFNNIFKYYKNKTELFEDNFKNIVFNIKYNKQFKFLNKITDYFVLPYRMKCVLEDKSMSAFDLFKNKLQNSNVKIDYGDLKNIIYSGECSLMYFTRVIIILKELFGNRTDIKYIDCNAAWGERMIAALLYGVKEYRAYDLNLSMKDVFLNIIDYFKTYKLIDHYGSGDQESVDTNKYNIIYKSFEFEYPEEIELINHFDVCISAPPFFKFNKYSEYNVQKYNSVDEWLDKYLYPSFKKILKFIKINGYICWYIEDKYNYPFIDKFISFTQTIKNCKYISTIGFKYIDANETRKFHIWQKNNIIF
jgi:hypothetical protein